MEIATMQAQHKKIVNNIFDGVEEMSLTFAQPGSSRDSVPNAKSKAKGTKAKAITLPDETTTFSDDPLVERACARTKDAVTAAYKFRKATLKQVNMLREKLKQADLECTQALDCIYPDFDSQEPAVHDGLLKGW